MSKRCCFVDIDQDPTRCGKDSGDLCGTHCSRCDRWFCDNHRRCLISDFDDKNLMCFWCCVQELSIMVTYEELFTSESEDDE